MTDRTNLKDAFHKAADLQANAIADYVDTNSQELRDEFVRLLTANAEKLEEYKARYNTLAGPNGPKDEKSAHLLQELRAGVVNAVEKHRNAKKAVNNGTTDPAPIVEASEAADTVRSKFKDWDAWRSQTDADIQQLKNAVFPKVATPTASRPAAPAAVQPVVKEKKSEPQGTEIFDSLQAPTMPLGHHPASTARTSSSSQVSERCKWSFKAFIAAGIGALIGAVVGLVVALIITGLVELITGSAAPSWLSSWFIAICMIALAFAGFFLGGKSVAEKEQTQTLTRTSSSEVTA